MSGEIDYRAVDIPEDKPPEDYTYAERRAEILREVEAVGSPRLVNGAELARRYGCTRQNIYNDLDRLAEYVERRAGDREALDAEGIYWRCIRELLDAGEPRKAAKTLADYHDWLHDRQELDHLWDRLEALEAEQDTETNPYRVK
jgi:hypothetical protein